MTKKVWGTPSFQKKNAWFFIAFFTLSLLLGVAVTLLALRNDLHLFQWAIFWESVLHWIDGWYALLAAFGCFTIMLFAGALRIYLMLKIKKQRPSFLDSFQYSLLSKYYVLITPLGLGGQPVTIAMMRDRHVPIGLATSIPTLDVGLMRLAMFVISAIAFLFPVSIVPDWVKWFTWIGFSFSTLIPVLVIALSFHPRFETIALKLLVMVSPFKLKAKFQTTLHDWFEKYRSSVATFRNNPWTMLAVFALAIASQLAILSIPFFTLLIYQQAFPISGPFSYPEVTVAMVYATNAIAIIPTLGNAGAAEFSFASIFGSFLIGNDLFWAIFLWRFITFYWHLLLGLFTTILQGINRKKAIRRHHIPDFSLPLRVYLFADNFYPNTDGVTRAIEGIANHLLSKGLEVVVVVPRSRHQLLQYPYKTIFLSAIRLPGLMYPLAVFPFSRKQREALYYEGPSIFHIHSPFFIGRKALKYAKENNIPTVGTLHSKYYDDFFQATNNRPLAKYLNRRVVQFYQKTDQVTTVSETTKKTMQSYGFSKSIEVFYNGTHFQKHEISEAELNALKRELRLENEAVLLFVGQLIWQKNFKGILESLALLTRRKFPFNMVVVGSGRNRKDILAYHRKLKLESRVRFVGRIDDNRTLSKYYQLADVLLFPSLYDNDPMVIKEAAVHGLPSIVATFSNASEKIRHRENGFILPANPRDLASGIEAIFQHPRLLKDIGEEARKTLATPWDETLKGLLALYRSVIEHFYDEE